MTKLVTGYQIMTKLVTNYQIMTKLVTDIAGLKVQSFSDGPYVV